MRKLIIFAIIVILLLSTSCNCSCNKDNTNSNDFKFLSKDEILSNFKTYHLKFVFVSKNGDESVYEIMENSNYFYCKDAYDIYYVEKQNNKVYTLAPNQKIKTYYEITDYDYNKTKNIILGYLTSHIDNVNSDFEKLPGSEKIGNYECNVYSYKKGTNSIYSIDSYYVEKNNGFCLKSLVEAKVSSNVQKSYWEISLISLDEKLINTTLSSYMEYETEFAPKDYSKWPTTGLGSMIPEYKNGKFDFGFETKEYLLISILDVTLSDVRSYCRQLQTTGFSEGKSITNEINQFIYLTYNSNNILVRVKYEPTNLSLTIRISQSTKEEIESELNKL